MSSLTLATGSCCKSQTTDVGGDKEWSRQNKLSTLRRTHPCSLASMRNTNTDNNTYTNTDRAQRRTHPRSLACFDEKYSGKPNTNTDEIQIQITIQRQNKLSTHARLLPRFNEEKSGKQTLGEEGSGNMRSNTRN